MPEQPPSSHNPEEWRGWVTSQLGNVTRDLETMQASIDKHHQETKDAFTRLIERIQPLEQLRSMVIGATVIILALSPLLWWLLTRAVFVAEKLGKQP
jgi:hypothetical protein